MEFSHQLGGYAGASGDAGAQVLEAFVWDGPVREEFQLGYVHGWNTVQCGTLLLLDAFQRRVRVECLCRENNCGSMRCRSHVSENAAEAVK